MGDGRDAAGGIVGVARGPGRGGAAHVGVARQAGHFVPNRIAEIDAGLGQAGAAELARGQAVGRIVGRGEHAAGAVLHQRAIVDRVVTVRQRQAKYVGGRGEAVEGVVAVGDRAVGVGSGQLVAGGVVTVGE